MCLILVNKDAIKLGRGHESNIRISDISVSRCHAIIKVIDKRFYIEDNNAKFGTLVGFTNPIPIDKHVSVQVGRSVLSFELNKGKTYWGLKWSKIHLTKATIDHIIDFETVAKYYPEACRK